MKKKLLALTMIAVLVITMTTMTACNKKVTDADETKVSTVEQAVETGTPAVEEKAEEVAEVEKTASKTTDASTAKDSTKKAAATTKKSGSTSGNTSSKSSGGSTTPSKPKTHTHKWVAKTRQVPYEATKEVPHTTYYYKCKTCGYRSNSTKDVERHCEENHIGISWGTYSETTYETVHYTDYKTETYYVCSGCGAIK